MSNIRWPYARAARAVLIAGLGAATPCVQGQIVPVSRLSRLSSGYFSSSSPPTNHDQTFTEWTSGSATRGSAFESVTLQSGSIQITATAGGYLIHNGMHYSGNFGSVESVFVFDVTAASAYTLSGSLFIGWSASSVELSRAGETVYSFASAPPWDWYPYSTQGTLAPGRYTLRVIVDAEAIDPGPYAEASVNLVVVPGPAAGAAVCLAAAVAGGRRRR